MSIDEDVARGIQREKTRESLAVFMAIGAVILAIIIGNLTSIGVGVLCMLGLFWLIWRYYYTPRKR